MTETQIQEQAAAALELAGRSDLSSFEREALAFQIAALDAAAQDTTPRHRATGAVGSFTIHAPADYQPRHAAHACTDLCDPGNCEVQHYWTFYIPED